MAAKLTFQDVFNDELAPEKFLPSPVYFSTGAIVPIHSAPCGSLYINTVTGGFYLNVSSPTPGTTWEELSDNVVNVEPGHHRQSVETSISVIAGSPYTPAVGDLVGIFGAGVWTSSGNLNNTYKLNNGCGSATAALNLGSNGTNHKLAETYDGSTWSNSANLLTSRYAPVDGGGVGASLGANVFGAINAAVCVGGYTGATGLTNCELFDGVTWHTSSASVPGTAGSISGMAAAGTSCSGVIFGIGFGTGHEFGYGTKYNGSIWSADYIAFQDTGINNQTYKMSASGSVNAVITISAVAAYTYNGTSAYLLTTVFMNTLVNCYLSGNPLMAYKYGGSSGSGPSVAHTNTEIYNGVVFSTNVGLNTARLGAQTKGAGSSSNCVAAAGRASGEPGEAITGLNSSEQYLESILYKKMYPQYVKNFNKPALYTGAVSLALRGNPPSTLYPPNKYLVVNKNAITDTGNQSNLSALLNVLQVGASGVLGTYSILETLSLQIIPGTIARITAAGPNPLSTNNVGIFVVKNIIPSSNTIVVINPTVTNQNPGTGKLELVTSMICVDYVDSSDIIIGSTDNNGVLTMDRMFQTTNYFSKTGI